MDFPITNKVQISHPLVSSLVLLSIAATILKNPVFAAKDCAFPAIFNFGASNADTGGLAASLYAPQSPYGETYFHRPAGRFSDGRIILDFMAQSLGLPYISPYLDSLGTNFSHGANFATAASTIRSPTIIKSRKTFSPFSLGVQFMQFQRFKPKTEFLRDQGGVFASLMPQEEYFSQALYTFDIGQNDLTAGFFSDMTLPQVIGTIPDIVNTFISNVKNVYNLGARSFWIHSTGPLGCLPSILANFLSTERDPYGCSKPHNEVCQIFNQKLKEALAQLRKDLPSAAITYVDIYSPKYALFRNPKKYGFKIPLITCCGYGRKYNYSDSAMCGGTITANGNKIFVGSCGDPSVRVIWDGTHYTEAANKVIFDQISSGVFSDPPISLKMACHRNST